MASKKAGLIGAIVVAPFVLPFGRTLAEEGIRATLGVSNRLESINENGYNPPQNDGDRFITALDFGLSAETGSQRFALGLGGGFAYNFNQPANSTDSTFDIKDPVARLSYGLESRNSELTFDGNYRRTDVDQANFFFDPLDGDIVSGQGYRTNYSLRTGLTLGRDAPVTFDFSHLYGQSLYSETTDTSLIDTTRNRVGGRISFRLSPVARLFTFADWDRLDRDDATSSNRTTQSYGLGMSYDVSRILTVTGDISHDESSDTEPGGSDSSGLGYALGAIREMPNGTLTADISRRETINGANTEVSVGRFLSLPRGNLSFSLGATQTDGFQIRPLTNLGLAYELNNTSKINVALSQYSAVSDDDDETIRTRLSMNYIKELNSISSLSVGAQLANQNDLSDNGANQTTMSANLTYRRAVGAEWDMVTGYRYITSNGDDQDDRSTSTLFVGLEKTFDLRP